MCQISSTSISKTEYNSAMDRSDKRFLRRIGKTVQAVPIALLVILLSISVAVSALSLRSNNQTMSELRQAVFVADEQGGDIEAALRELREYVYAHMNTNLEIGDNSVYPPIQLKYTYERLVQAEQAKVAINNEEIYTAAQRHCEQLHPGSFSGGPRVPCIQEYIEQHGVKTAPIPDSLYKFDFVSPAWSPDLAGWSLVASGLLIVLLAIRLVIPFVLKQLRVL